jgi:threonylcarbamoyladenosine tRNA methylthiotransferase CDKAL1
MKVYVDCHGCEQRQLDAQRIINYAKSNNHDIVASPDSCDYGILVTCGVDSGSEETSLRKAYELKKSIPKNAKLLIGGCLPSISPDKMNSIEANFYFSPSNLESLDSFLCEEESNTMANTQRSHKSIFDLEMKNTSSNNQAREEYDQAKKGYKIVIADGCAGSCSYCVIKEGIGNLKSQPLETVISSLK